MAIKRSKEDRALIKWFKRRRHLCMPALIVECNHQPTVLAGWHFVYVRPMQVLLQSVGNPVAVQVVLTTVPPKHPDALHSVYATVCPGFGGTLPPLKISIERLHLLLAAVIDLKRYPGRLTPMCVAHPNKYLLQVATPIGFTGFTVPSTFEPLGAKISRLASLYNRT